MSHIFFIFADPQGLDINEATHGLEQLPVPQPAMSAQVQSNLKTYTIPDPHLSQMGNLSAFPTDDPIFVDGAFTLLNPDGLSESPVNAEPHTQSGITSPQSFIRNQLFY